MGGGDQEQRGGTQAGGRYDAAAAVVLKTVYVTYFYLDFTAPKKPPKRNPMEDAQDPLRVLEWYKRMLGSQLTNELMFVVLSKFYDDLDKVGVIHG